jgi:hypothetical protein
MPFRTILGLAACLSASAAAQEIVEVPADKANVPRPDDLYQLPPNQWHFAKQLWEGNEACAQQQCEAGYTSGDLVVSVEHAAEFVRIIAALRGCAASAYSEVEVGQKPSKSARKRVAKQVQRVVKGLGQTCKSAPPVVPALDPALLFPASG